MTTLDECNAIARRLVIGAKDIIENTGWLEMSGVFFVGRGAVRHVVRVQQPRDSEMCGSMYSSVTAMAETMKPEVVITVNSGYFRHIGTGSELMFAGSGAAEGMEWDHEARLCLLASIKGLDVGSWFLYVPYRKNDLGVIEWESASELMDSREFGSWMMVEDWWGREKES